MKFTSKRPAFGTVLGISMLLVAATSSASLALAAPTGTASSAAQLSASASAFGTGPEIKGASAGAGVQRWIPLITGDRIAVDAKGEIVAARPAEGREDIPIRVETRDGHTYALPDDARDLVRSGRVDRRLFDITTLSTPAYADRHDLRLIVMYDAARPAARSALRAAGGAKVERTLPSVNADAVAAPADGSAELWAAVTSGSADAMKRSVASGIASVWLDSVVQASLDKSVPQIGGPEAWAAGFDGTGTRIAVLDTGVDTTHPDLAGQVVAEQNFSDSPDTEDRFGHGTHVASTTAGTGAKSGGTYKGVAPGARLLNGKVLGDSGSGSMSQIIAGMEWAVAEKADVVNLSLGGYDSPEIDPAEEAVNRLSAESGTLFVIAAGNNGEQGAGTVGSPGSADAALTVGAVDKQDKLAPFSSTGPRVGDGGIKPDLTAPGVAIGAAAAHDSYLSTVAPSVADGYIALNGTSMATPHVAGAAAILVQQHPDWTGEDIKDALVSSTTPGGYTPFEQGSGRVDLRNAIKQTVVARQTSLSFGLAQWPHTDDQPLTKDLTYRNTGSAPVTLKLTVDATGPDGNPAPGGMFTADEQVTVPAHGEATVKVTADTRLGGDTTGAFTGRITAAGEGQTVGTALAVDRESEMYTVTVKTLDRKGKPAPAPAWDAQLQGLEGPAKGASAVLYGDTYSVRLPKGRYFLNSMVRVDPEGTNSQGGDWFNQPNLDVTKDTVVTVDARTAKPLDITVPDRSAQHIFGHFSAGIELPDGYNTLYGVFTSSLAKYRTAHLGPKAPAGDTLTQQLAASFSTGVNGHDEYHLVYQPTGDRYLTGFTHHAKAREFAKVQAKLGAPAKGKFGFVTPITEGGAGLGTVHALPYTGTLHLLSGNPSWQLSFMQVDANDSYETSYDALPRTFKPGRSYEHVFNVGVFGPDLPEGAGLIGLLRADEAIDGRLPLFSDSEGNISNNHSPIESARTYLYRNGELVNISLNPMDVFYIAENERADYRLTVSVKRGTVADVSTSMTASWTFSSEYAPGITKLPTSVVRFTPALSLDNTGKARAKTWVPVTVKGTAAGRNLKSLSVWASYDKGANWQKLNVCDGRVQVSNPKAGGSVSFKAQAVDKQGNTVDETIVDAYLTK
ncbi:S8 family serine peptidase [Actinacidiphila glaucinigra]|uniref:S8 family peptidase n=1 Tax=Actinacidiphila glaucinigra TaxID=235986 RepID=UPI0032530ABF